ncbi:dehydrogenase/reductase SDR family member 11 isoform X3 [Heterocephalus glaber]|uniref:Dehydrogenase/reductase SDR family member 11 isoform X3 n=1 Tax=Heterocephalus glaber TaxID=10181 RepID=A0AAX6S7A6_HETGA|nr:dehydrogenase/reductase SDR family member 11 isoform X3 [Heterocephalus glaber]
MWPGAEDRRAEPRPEAGQHGGGPRRGSNASRLAAAAGAVTRERPNLASQGRSSVSEVGGRLGTMARAGMERWRDRLALVTGASGGIGAAVARALVQQGLKVVGCARTVGNIEELAAECKSAGYPGTLIPYRCDLSNEEDILSMFSAVRSQHSGVDICINNAGLARPDSLLSGSTSGWKDMFNVNVLALSICTREAYQSMKERSVDDGHIININSASLQAWWRHSSPSNSMTRTLREQLLPMNASSVSNPRMWLRLSSTSSAVPHMSRLETSR